MKKIILPNDIIKIIFSFNNFCKYKNNNIIKIYHLSKYWNNYYNKKIKKCKLSNSLCKHCCTHYKEIYVPTDNDWIIFIEHEYILN